MMTIKAANAIAGSLGYPSKMPGTAYGIPAQACITGSKLAKVPGSTCASCYAMRGNYIFRDVKKSQATRLAGITSPDWVEAMVTLLTAVHTKGINPKTKQPLDKVHRWHDSGDLQSRDHLAKICAVARATPWLRHWLPTREGMLLKGFVRDGGEIPANLVIRLSATMVDGAAPTAWPQTSTVHDKSDGVGERCGAPLRDNKCGPCRLCWDAAVANVSYHIH
jgi:Gene product 88